MPGSNYTVATAAQLVGATSAIKSERTSWQSVRSTETRRSDHGRRGTEIYFSPLVEGNQVELSSPLPTPPSTPTQRSFDAKQAASRSEGGDLRRMSRLIAQEKGKLTLSQEQLDKLVAALANAPIVHNHVRKQWWEGREQADETKTRPMSVLSGKSTDALKVTREPGHSDSAQPSLYSVPNQPLLAEQPRVKPGSIMIADPKVTGSPIRLVSKDSNASPRAPRPGQSSQLTISDGSSIESHVRFEAPATNASNTGGKVLLQIVTQVLERKTGKKTYVLAAEADVTESFTKAALVELAAGTDMSLNDIEIVTSTDDSRHDSKEDVDLWSELADELEARCTMDQVVDAAIELFASLNMESATMQMLTLMSELRRIRSQHQDFVVVRSYEQHKNGTPARMGVPYISEHFAKTLMGDCPLSPDSVQKFREALVREVAARKPSDTAFSTWIKWDRERAKVHCVAMTDETGKPIAWACFVKDDYDF